MTRIYDVFISYSRHDRDWVEETLLAHLEQAGLRVCVADRDYALGVATIINTEHAIQQSHKTLLVITPEWLAEVWQTFESLLLLTRDPTGQQQRMVPLLVRACQLPNRLELFTSLNLTDASKQESQLRRLVDEIRRTLPAIAARQPTTTRAANPFGDTGRITNPARFFDREDIRRRIFEELEKGVNLSLVGAIQVGKSSLLEMVCAKGPQQLGLPAAAFVYLNLELVDNEHEFYEALCEALGIATSRGFQLTRALRGRRHILCLDEIEKMAWDGFTVGLRSHLRGLADGANAPLKLVIASRSSLERLFPDSPELDSPLAGICRQLDVGPFTPDIARAFLAERLGSTNVSFSTEQIGDLLLRSGGHPAKLQRAAADLYDQITVD
jgi:hypothetical protein